MTVRVAIIDDDDITRAGTLAILGAHPEVRVLSCTDHRAATGPWADIDLAIVDASDHRRAEDHFPGVAVVKAIRATGNATCTIIVLTGVISDDVVRRRMREAGADFYYHRSELIGGDQLIEIVLGRCPRAVIPEPADPETLFRLGVTERTRVNDAIAAAHEHGLISGQPGLEKRGQVRTRRRAQFNQRARLSTVTTAGRPPDRSQDTPSLPQIDRFLRWATRIGR